MKLETKYYTITIMDKCFDMPKTMLIPNTGDLVFIHDMVGVVQEVKYFIVDNKLFTVNINATMP